MITIILEQEEKEEEKILVMGNQAIAHGLLDGGIKYAASYPGTPSTEIMELLVDLADGDTVKAKWAANEAVALEQAAAAAITGVDAAFVCKSVGLNVAMDPLMTLAFTGVNASLIVIVADDPAMHSSQNEQDNRLITHISGIPMFAPSTIQEAYHYSREAILLSRKFKIPVFIRTTTRLSHALGSLVRQPPITLDPIPYEKNPKQYVSIPGNARVNHLRMVEDVYPEIEVYVEEKGLWKEFILDNDPTVLIVADGVAATYTIEVADQLDLSAHIFVPKVVNPLPANKLKQLITKYDKIYVVEELEPHIENFIRTLLQKEKLSRTVVGKGTLTKRTGELSVELLKNNLSIHLGLKSYTPKKLDDDAKEMLLMRPPVLCAGCPHRSSYVAMQKIFKRYNPIYANDIGCYSLGVLPPLNAADMLICMGASIPMATSIAQNHPDRLGVAVIGDSTFWHSGLPGLANAIWQQANIVVVVMDNDTTAMTGAQPNPSNTREKLPHGSLDIAKTAEAMGAKVWVMNPMEYDESRAILREVVKTEGVRVIVSQYPCALIENKEKTSAGIELEIASVDQELCNGCHICIDTTGCPGLKILENGKITIDPTLCNGCSYCSSHCHRGGITTISRSELSGN